MATYDNNLRIKEIATGAEAGTWGTSTNLNLELIGEALGYSTQNCFATDADATTTVADGASDPARAMYFKVTSSATLTATRTLTFAPATLSRVMWIENATTGSQSITIAQGSGSTVTITSGAVKSIYFDGAGAGASVVEFSSADLTSVPTDVLPTTDDNNDLGSASKRWQDLYLSNGVVFGAVTGSIDSKTLDDYEQGTFTTTTNLDPDGGTVSSRQGWYIKIGKKVTIFYKLTGSNMSISASQPFADFSPLPFQPDTSRSGTYAGSYADGVSWGSRTDRGFSATVFGTGALSFVVLGQTGSYTFSTIVATVTYETA